MESKTLIQGSIYCSVEPANITTVLGSCVSVCLFDVNTKIGGMNHFLLPKWSEGEDASPRYGDISIDMLIEEMGSLGCLRDNLIAKVFGGADVFNLPGSSIGHDNVSYALDHLKMVGIPVVAGRTGGNSGIRICLHTSTGKVFVRSLGPAFLDRIPSPASSGKKHR